MWIHTQAQHTTYTVEYLLTDTFDSKENFFGCYTKVTFVEGLLCTLLFIGTCTWVSSVFLQGNRYEDVTNIIIQRSQWLEFLSPIWSEQCSLLKNNYQTSNIRVYVLRMASSRPEVYTRPNLSIQA